MFIELHYLSYESPEDRFIINTDTIKQIDSIKGETVISRKKEVDISVKESYDEIKQKIQDTYLQNKSFR